MARKKSTVENRFNALFFMRRRPKTHISLEWQHPGTEERYQDALEYEGLVSSKAWESANPQEKIADYQALKQDLDDLEQWLMPAFWEFNQKALHFQNRFYFYQWIFMLGAFLTTLLGVLTTYAYTRDNATLPQAFGYATAIVSGITAYFSVLNNQSSPQVRWARSRRMTEELRSAYFRYLAHLPPFDRIDRVDMMRKFVLDVRQQERRENG